MAFSTVGFREFALVLRAYEMRLRGKWIDDLRARMGFATSTSFLGCRHLDAAVPEDFDGHPTAIGHRVVAAEIERHITDIAAARVQ